MNPFRSSVHTSISSSQYANVQWPGYWQLTPAATSAVTQFNTLFEYHPCSSHVQDSVNVTFANVIGPGVKSFCWSRTDELPDACVVSSAHQNVFSTLVLQPVEILVL